MRRRLASGDTLALLNCNGIESPGVVYCVRIGNDPRADWLEATRTRRDLDPATCAVHALEKFTQDPAASLAILCELDVDGNKEAQEDALAGVTTQFRGLMGNVTLKKIVLQSPHRFVVALVEGGTISLRKDVAETLVGELRDAGDRGLGTFEALFHDR